MSWEEGGLLSDGGVAAGDAMLGLVGLVQQRVREQFGVQLECEVRIIR